MFLYFSVPGHLYELHEKHFTWPGHMLLQCKQVHDHSHITVISAQECDGELHCWHSDALPGGRDKSDHLQSPSSKTVSDYC